MRDVDAHASRAQCERKMYCTPAQTFNYLRLPHDFAQCGPVRLYKTTNKGLLIKTLLKGPPQQLQERNNCVELASTGVCEKNDRRCTRPYKAICIPTRILRGKIGKCGFHTSVAQRGPVRIQGSNGPFTQTILKRPSQQL